MRAAAVLLFLPGPLPAPGDSALSALILSLPCPLGAALGALLLCMPGLLPALGDNTLGALLVSLPDPLGGALGALLLYLAHKELEDGACTVAQPSPFPWGRLACRCGPLSPLSSLSLALLAAPFGGAGSR